MGVEPIGSGSKNLWPTLSVGRQETESSDFSSEGFSCFRDTPHPGSRRGGVL